MNNTFKVMDNLTVIRRKIRGLAFMATVAAFALLQSGISQASPISWNAAEDITDASDVYTAGSLEYAVTLGTAVTFGGVAFSAETYTPVSLGTTSLGANIDLTNFGRPLQTTSGAAAPFTSLDSTYQTLLGKAAAGDGGAGSFITVKNLTVGQDYAVQIWASRSDQDWNTTLTVGGTAALDPNTTDLTGGIGQFVIGTFTADAATQSFQYSQVGGGGGRTFFNAIQVRDMTIPEPGSLALFGMAALIVTALRRRAALR